MSYSTDMAGILTKQLTRFVSLHSYQLAAHVENLDFWLSEVRHLLAVIDGYGVRFVRLEAAQERYLQQIQNGKQSLSVHQEMNAQKPKKIRRVPDHDLRKTRRELVNATKSLLARCKVEGLISENHYSIANKSLEV
jgi:hypothetical protein